MIYQLPNGKAINISLEDYLNLSDEDIAYLVSLNYGDTITSPWYGSSIEVNNKSSKSELIDEEITNTDFIIDDSDTFLDDIPDDFLDE